MGIFGRILFVSLVICLFLFIASVVNARESLFLVKDAEPNKEELSLVLKISENGNSFELDLGLLLESLQIASSYHVDRKKFDHSRMVSGMVTGLLRALNSDQRQRLLEVSKLEPYDEEANAGRLSLKVTSNDGLLFKIDASYFLWSLELAVRNGVLGKRKNPKRLVEYITKGLIGSLDKHSEYFTLDEVEEYIASFDQQGTVSYFNMKFKGEIIHVIGIDEFTKSTAREFKKIVTDKIKEKNAYVIFDLRDCPGGLDDPTEEILGYLLGADKVLLSELDYLGKTTKKFSKKSDGPGVCKDWKISCIVNDNTASNAEVFAGCLRDNVVVRLVGTTTYGKGVGGTIVELDSGLGACKITYTRWFTPSGYCVEGVGLKPDVSIADIKKRGRDLPLDAALYDLVR